MIFSRFSIKNIIVRLYSTNSANSDDRQKVKQGKDHPQRPREIREQQGNANDAEGGFLQASRDAAQTASYSMWILEYHVLRTIH